MKKPLITLIIMVIVIGMSYGVWRSTRQAATKTAQSAPSTTHATDITYQNGAFTPASISIKVGESIRFVNSHRAAILIAPNPHPVHTSFPKLYSDRIEPGESFPFTFTEKAEVHFHNHYNPSVEGTIRVE